MEKEVTTGKGGMMKPYLNQAKKVGVAVGGFAAGHLAFSNAPVSFKSGVQGIVTTLLVLTLGLFAAVKVKNEYVQNAALGLSVYSGVRLINGAANLVPAISATTGQPVQGLAGFSLPAPVSKVLNMILPNLGEAQAIPWNLGDYGDMTIYDHNTDLGAAIDATYETVGDLIDISSSHNPVSGLGDYQVKVA